MITSSNLPLPSLLCYELSRYSLSAMQVSSIDEMPYSDGSIIGIAFTTRRLWCSLAAIFAPPCTDVGALPRRGIMSCGPKPGVRNGLCEFAIPLIGCTRPDGEAVVVMRMCGSGMVPSKALGPIAVRTSSAKDVKIAQRGSGWLTNHMDRFKINVRADYRATMPRAVVGGVTAIFYKSRNKPFC